MDSFEKKITRNASKIRMQAHEKGLLREQLLAFMEYHPVAESLSQKNARLISSVRTPYKEVFTFIQLSSWQFRLGVGAFCAIFFIGTPALAEKTVPGDILYPVKVRVNEEVLSQLSLTPYKKVTWETHRVERRIAEARLLAKEGRLTDEIEAQITETVKEHTATAQKELVALRETDADQAALAQVTVDSVLEVQTAMLDTADTTAPQGGEQMLALAAVVRDAKETLTPAPESSTTLSSYQLFSDEAVQAAEDAKELFATLKESLSESEQGDIQRRLDDVDRRVAAARLAYEGSATNTALDTIKEALGDTQKITSFMSDIEVRQTVALETLVPKELTQEERLAALGAARTEMARELAQVKSRIVFSDEAALREKVFVGVGEAEKYMVAIDAGLQEGGSLEAAEAARASGEELVKDLLAATTGLDAVVDLGVGDVSSSTLTATVATPSSSTVASTTNP